VSVALGRLDDFVAAGLGAIIDADRRLVVSALGVELDDLHTVGTNQVVVVDVGLVDGPRAMLGLTRQFPNTGFVLFAWEMTDAPRREFVSVGACGWLTPPLARHDVSDVLLRAARREPPSVRPRPVPQSRGPLFSEREREVLTLLRDGMSNPQIATALCISTETAKSHVASILSKLGLSSRRDVLNPFASSSRVLSDTHVHRVPCTRRSALHGVRAPARNWLLGAPSFGRRVDPRMG
jgi:DNA-binding NarL/FixJ family response regulator